MVPYPVPVCPAVGIADPPATTCILERPPCPLSLIACEWASRRFLDAPAGAAEQAALRCLACLRPWVPCRADPCCSRVLVEKRSPVRNGKYPAKSSMAVSRSSPPLPHLGLMLRRRSCYLKACVAPAHLFFPGSRRMVCPAAVCAIGRITIQPTTSAPQIPLPAGELFQLSSSGWSETHYRGGAAAATGEPRRGPSAVPADAGPSTTESPCSGRMRALFWSGFIYHDR